MHVVQDVHVINSLSVFLKILWKFMCWNVKLKSLRTTAFSLRNGRYLISGTTWSSGALLPAGYDGQNLFWSMYTDCAIFVPECMWHFSVITSPLGRGMLQLPFYSWEHDKIHDHILCFSPGLLFHTSYTGIWGKIPGDSSEGCLNLGYCAGKGVLVHKAMHLWHYCITSGAHTSSHWLDIFIRRYRENWKLTCFTWNYARILIKYFLFAVGEELLRDCGYYVQK